MGEKIRKLTAWVWNVKERIILAIMVAILCERVYDVMNPKSVDDALPIPRKPASDASGVIPPNNPPPPPSDLIGESWSLLHIRPVTLFEKPYIGQRDRDDDFGSNLELQEMRKSGKNYSVKISTGQGRARWYREGESFESYEIVFIDPDKETVQVYSEEANKTITLNIN